MFLGRAPTSDCPNHCWKFIVPDYYTNFDMQRAHTYDSTRMPSLDGILKTCEISKNYYILAPAFTFAWSARFLHRWRFLSKNLKYGQTVKLFYFCKKEGGKCQKMTPISNDNVSAKIFAILPCSNKYSHYWWHPDNTNLFWIILPTYRS